ncbi:MAG TPA: hypothetical protein VGS97_06480 [Actinocrinis sp.]|uniref:hypothetical protein n=1 Tax=Actinocrinis sp. TaxID=1920516 RepID=UPI002DDCBCFB|nr:hypothetical protein [Actinocrinis sp.]HEV2343718.1 hypothetical protein [Actinocrinis sp.]
MEAEDGESAERGRTAAYTTESDGAQPDTEGRSSQDRISLFAPRDDDAEPDAGADTDPDSADETEAETGPDAADRRARPEISGGIGCTALLLPLVAVAGAVLTFFAGVLSTATGCAPNGSALCSSNGPWYAFALPVFVSPLVAAAAAIGAVTVRRHRSTWLAVGYAVVFISVIVGLATASTGSS